MCNLVSAKVAKKFGLSFPCWISTITSRQNPCFCLLSTIDMVPFPTVQTANCHIFWRNTPKFILERGKNTTGQDTYPTSFPQCWAISYHTFNILAELWNCKTNTPKLQSTKTLDIFQVTEPAQHYTLRKEKTNKNATNIITKSPLHTMLLASVWPFLFCSSALTFYQQPRKAGEKD